jgi:protoporphyrinogen oxidase
MHVGIIGGGLMGAALAYFLTQAGQQVTILEQSSELGGLNGEFRLSPTLKIARYQHAILPVDQSVRALCAELGLENELIFRKSYVGFVHNHELYAMSSVRDFMSFPPLSLLDRIWLGKLVVSALKQRDWRELDNLTVKEWLVRLGGARVFEQIWRPLLEAKFDGVYDTLPATYMWAWLHRMSTSRLVPQLQGAVGYLRGGHYSLIRALLDCVTQRGGHIETNVRVREIELNGGAARRVRTLDGVMEFDAVVAAIATPTFALLIPGASHDYRAQLAKSKYLGLICPVMVVNQPLSPYWTLNLTDPTCPFSTVIETPHPEHPNYHVVYLPRYTAPENDWMGVSDEEIREAWYMHLKKIFPNFAENQVHYFGVSRARYAEPVYSVGSLRHSLSARTPYEGLYLANTGQVYPALPTSEAAIAHARQITRFIVEQQPSRVAV